MLTVDDYTRIRQGQSALRPHFHGREIDASQLAAPGRISSRYAKANSALGRLLKRTIANSRGDDNRNESKRTDGDAGADHGDFAVRVSAKGRIRSLPSCASLGVPYPASHTTAVQPVGKRILR